MPLQQGDEVYAREPGVRVEINERGARRWATFDRPYVTPKISLAQTLFPWAQPVLTNGLDRYVPLGTRAPSNTSALAACEMFDAGSVIAPGDRRLAWEWRGGDAPFTVSLRTAGFQKTYKNVPDQAGWTQDPIPCPAGACEITIRDARGAEIVNRFRAEGSPAAVLPQTQPVSDLTERLVRALRIFEAAARGPASATYEAYLAIATAVADPSDLMGAERVLMTLIARRDFSGGGLL
ncbi:MAG: hypothetical protein QM608_06250 [Caulobacter sp.]